MTPQMNVNILDETHPSIFIPHVFTNISEVKIRQVMDELSLGKISRIDIVKERKNEKGASFNRVYIHFEKWYLNEEAQTTRIKLLSGKEIKIIYDNPWFWKVSANKWEPSPIPVKQKLLFKNDFRDKKYESSLTLSLSDLNTNADDFDFGRDLILSDLNTDDFGRDLTLSDLNTDDFGRDLSMSDLNINTDEFGRDLTLSDLNTDNFGRDLSMSDLNINTDEFGRDLTLKRDYPMRRRMVINNFINNFRPINRRFNDKRLNKRRKPLLPPARPMIPLREVESESEPEEQDKRVILPFRFITEDVDNLNIPKIEIDYGSPIPVPKMKRITIKKTHIPLPFQNVKKQMNWYDDDDTDDEYINDTDNFLTKVFNKMDINDTDKKFRPSSPDYPPPNYQEDEIVDIYADLDTYVDSELDL
jgi:hypothetical protein